MTTLQVRNPRNGELDYQIPFIDEDQIKHRADQLRLAQSNWQAIGVQQRCLILKQWQQAVSENAEAIIEALSIDTGRRLISEFEVHGLIGMIERWAARAPELLEPAEAANSKMAPSVSVRHKLVPYSLVGVISPWNFPMTLSMIDTIPALLTGASVLLKPSEVTPRFIAPLQKTIDQVEGLKDVLNIVTRGAETGIAIIDNVDSICFTGSVPTGRKVGMQAAKNFIPAFLELGGKDPAIVLASADIDNACNAILRSAAGSTGQACQSLERIYVHESIFADFVSRITSKASATKYNWPTLNEGQIGPLIFAAQAEKIQAQIEQAVTAGAKVHCGGKLEHHDGGCWIAPTVMTNVDHTMQIMTEETFGPIIPIMPFQSTEQAIQLANDSIYGLSGAVFGSDHEEINTVAEQIEVGAVSINDASLTALVNDAEKNSFKLSGIGGSRMGESGFTRFLRKRAILQQTNEASSIDLFSEKSPNN